MARRAQLPRPISLESRGPAGSPVRQAMDRMLQRARSLTSGIDGATVEGFLTKYILQNPGITNQQLLELESVGLEDLTAPANIQDRALKAAPQIRSTPSHRFGIGLFAAATGLPYEALSQALPDVGLTGSTRSVGYHLMKPWVPRSVEEQKTTALHDFTDIMTVWGKVKLNKAVWGYMNTVQSAAASLRGLPLDG
jgi:hypothetical protein